MSLISGTKSILLRAKTYINNIDFWEDELEVDITNLELRLQNYNIKELTNDFNVQALNLLATAAPSTFNTDNEVIDYYDKNRELLELMFLLTEFLSTVWSNVLIKFVEIMNSIERNLVYIQPKKSNSKIQRERVVIILFLKDPKLLINVQLYQVAYNRGFRQIDLSNLSDEQKSQLMTVSNGIQERIASNIKSKFNGITGRVRFIDQLKINSEIFFFFKSEYKRSSTTKINETDFVTEADWFILQLNSIRNEMRIASSGARIGKNYLQLLYKNLFPKQKIKIKELTPCYEKDFVKSFVETIIRDTNITFSGIRIVSTRFGQPYIQLDEIKKPILTIFDSLVSNNYISLEDISNIHHIKITYKKTKFTIYLAKCIGDDDKISLELSTRNTREDLIEFEEYLLNNYKVTPIQGRGDYIDTKSQFSEVE